MAKAVPRFRASVLVALPAVLCAMWFAPVSPAAAATAALSCVAGFQDNGATCARDFPYKGTPIVVSLPGVGVLQARVSGGQGGDSREEGDIVQSSLGGLGGREVATLPVVPGEPLTVLTGRAGADGGLQNYGGGYGGGGNPASVYGGGGGGGSFVFDADGVLIAAGGGGGGGYDPNPTYTGGQIPNSEAPGGAGSGNTPAGDGQSVAFCCDASAVPPGGGLGATPAFPGTGGTPPAGVPPSFGPVAGETGWGPATGPDVLGKGGDSYPGQGSGGGVGWAGGGGGGFYGGGGGGNIEFWLEGGGGGGGAGTVDPGAWNDTASVGVQPNGGMVTLSYAKNQPAAPTINSIFPRIGAPGHDLTVNGSNLTGATTVRFGGVPATTFSVVSPTQVVATIPPDALEGPVIVTTPGGKARSPSWFSLRHILPDALIRAPGSTTDTGEEIYNTTALHQTASASAKAHTKLVFRITVQNDGDQTDSVLVHGPGRTGPFAVRYLAGAAGSTVVTAAVRAGTYEFTDLPPGAHAVLRVEITADAGTRPGATATRLVTVTSATDPTLRDAVQARVSVTP